MTIPASVFVITRNEEARLGATLRALEEFDDVVVVDSGSTDRTVAIAEEMGARVFHRDWEGYGPQKAFAEAQCTHRWVLNVDADEIVPPDLAAELGAIAERAAPGAYKMRILTIYPGGTAPRPFANDYNVVRFYHRDIGGYRAHPLFDRVEHSGRPGQLTAPLHHHTFTSFGHFVDKENIYSDYVAETARPRGRLGLMVRLPFEMPLSFLKFYLLRRHITGGWRGFVFAMVAAFSRMMRVAKMLETADRKGQKKKRD